MLKPHFILGKFIQLYIYIIAILEFSYVQKKLEQNHNANMQEFTLSGTNQIEEFTVSF